MVDAATLSQQFSRAQDWPTYLASDAARAEPWRSIYAATSLTAPQAALLGSFRRRMHVLCLSGIWCGDCSAQGPMLQRIAEASPLSQLRFADRDLHASLAEQVRICGGLRVPTVIFMAEDFAFCALLGDRTISRYRAIATRQLGESCPLPGAPADADSAAATLQEWVNEFERVHLMLCLSARLRERHGD